MSDKSIESTSPRQLTKVYIYQRAKRTELFRFGSTEFLKSRFGFGSVRFGSFSLSDIYLKRNKFKKNLLI
jgi:hypothetical protein